MIASGPYAADESASGDSAGSAGEFPLRASASPVLGRGAPPDDLLDRMCAASRRGIRHFGFGG